MQITYIVSPAQDGMVLHDVLRRGLGLSAQLCKTVKRTPGALTVDGAPMYANQRVRAGMCICVCMPQAQAQPGDKALSALRIVYEDEALLCVDKPSGIVCHPTRGLAPGEETMLGRAADYLGFTPHPVHRLDRGTSGLLLFAKNGYAQSKLEEMHKGYEAICVGVPQALEGEITLPILTVPEQARRVVDPAGQRACTRYQVLAGAHGLAHVQLTLCTGRTHQIRVHMAAIGCPVLGDTLYGDTQALACAQQRGVTRLMLNACALRFTHPITGEGISLTCACQTFPTLIKE